MEEFTLDFYGETVKIQKPEELSLLRIQISEQFHFCDEENWNSYLLFQK